MPDSPQIFELEWGVRGGPHIGTLWLTDLREAQRAAAAFVKDVCPLQARNPIQVHGSIEFDWLFQPGEVRKTWRNETHFVALTCLSELKAANKSLRPASWDLWLLAKGNAPKESQQPEVLTHYAWAP